VARAGGRLHDIFDAKGDKNVAWVWCPSALGFKSAAASWYPGDTYGAFVCYDVKRTALSTGRLLYDFRIDTYTTALASFKALAKDPYFNPKH